jgi:SAM-dependent methyltransferase
VTDAELDRTRRLWDRYSAVYDQRIQRTERMLFPGGRKWACAQAAGDVLEIAVGTGRNLPNYPPVQSLTGIDLSPGVLAVARDRATALGLDADLRVGTRRRWSSATRHSTRWCARFRCATSPRGSCSATANGLDWGGSSALSPSSQRYSTGKYAYQGSDHQGTGQAVGGHRA